MKMLSRVVVPIVTVEDIDGMGIDPSFGCSTYKGVMIYWDENYDHRILDVLDSMEQNHRYHLIACAHYEEALYFMWNYNYTPPDYLQGSKIPVRGGAWEVIVSRAINRSKVSDVQLVANN
jgi:hypothetical protein